MFSWCETWSLSSWNLSFPLPFRFNDRMIDLKLERTIDHPTPSLYIWGPGKLNLSRVPKVVNSRSKIWTQVLAMQVHYSFHNTILPSNQLPCSRQFTSKISINPFLLIIPFATTLIQGFFISPYFLLLIPIATTLTQGFFMSCLDYSVTC